MGLCKQEVYSEVVHLGSALVDGMGWPGERKKLPCDAEPRDGLSPARSSSELSQDGPVRPGLSPLPWSVTGCSFFLGGKVILLWRQSLKGVLPASIPVAGTSPSYYVSSALQGLVGGASQSPLQSRPGHWEPGSSPFPSHELGETRTRPPLQLPPPPAAHLCQ